MTRVFVSSTVFDLVDIRAELEALLREMNLTPVLSDSNTSDFGVAPDMNSVECCLENLRKCDVVIVVLCQRYGPAIPVLKDGQHSATHLEYLEAKKANIPIYLYARGRLDADLALRKRNSSESFRPAWAKGDNANRLLDFLDEHKSLAAAKGRSNWAGTFTDSIDLKQLVRRDLRATASRADLDQRIRSNQVPWVQTTLGFTSDHPDQSPHLTLRLSFLNLGTVPAFRCTWRVEGNDSLAPMVFPVLAPGQEATQAIIEPNDRKPRQWQLTVEYFTSAGDRIVDTYEAGFRFAPYNQVFCGASFKRKTFFPSDGSVTPYTIAPPFDQQADVP